MRTCRGNCSLATLVTLQSGTQLGGSKLISVHSDLLKVENTRLHLILAKPPIVSARRATIKPWVSIRTNAECESTCSCSNSFMDIVVGHLLSMM